MKGLTAVKERERKYGDLKVWGKVFRLGFEINGWHNSRVPLRREFESQTRIVLKEKLRKFNLIVPNDYFGAGIM